MEGFMTFKRGSLRFWKAEMKKYYFVLTHNPTNAELKYVLTWYKDDTKNKHKGTLNISPRMQIVTGEHKQLFLGYYFQLRGPEDNELYHFSLDTKELLEKWIAKFREATLIDVYAGVTKANKFKDQTVINIFLTNSCIAFVHPITEETLLSWKLSQIVSFVFDQSEFSFVICSKCSKCAGRFTQEVTLQTSILIIGTMEDRISSLYAKVPDAVITHDKNISGDVYRVPHVCRRVIETKPDILYNSSLLRSPRVNSNVNSPAAPFSKQFLNNWGPRGNHGYIRSLTSSPVNHPRFVPLSPGINFYSEAPKYNSLPSAAKQRVCPPIHHGRDSRGYNTKFSFDETASSKNWHSNSYSHTHNQVIHEDCLAEIKFPESYEPRNRMLKLAASMENLEIKDNSKRRVGSHLNQSRLHPVSSTDTSDISEVLSQSNYSPSPYSSSTGHSNHSSSLRNHKGQGNVETDMNFTAVHEERHKNVCSPPVETERLRTVNSGHTCVLSQEPKGGRVGRITLGKNQYSVPRGCEDQLTSGVTDSEHVYSIPHLHSRSMELLNPMVIPPASSSNTSSSEYYEHMTSSIGVRHRPKHINTNRMGKSRAVRKSLNKRENPLSNSSNSSYTSETSGNSSVSTDDGAILDAKRVYF